MEWFSGREGERDERETRRREGGGGGGKHSNLRPSLP